VDVPDPGLGLVGVAEEAEIALVGRLDRPLVDDRVVERDRDEVPERGELQLVPGAGAERRPGGPSSPFGLDRDIPAIAVSDAHSLLEVGVAYTAFDEDVSTPSALLAALASAEIVPGRASYVMRALTPVAKLIQRVRGNRQVEAGTRS